MLVFGGVTVLSYAFFSEGDPGVSDFFFVTQVFPHGFAKRVGSHWSSPHPKNPPQKPTTDPTDQTEVSFQRTAYGWDNYAASC